MDSDKREITAERRALLQHAALIDWDPEYNLGISIIDIQHQGLVSTINSLHFAIVNSFGENILEPIVSMVKEYARTHFMTEEFFFRAFDFPGARGHVELHNKLIDTLLDAGQESMFNQDPGYFLQFLKGWLVQHILREDRAYRDCFLAVNRDAPKTPG